MSATYQIAGRTAPAQDLTKIAADSQFARGIARVFADMRPRRIIETGTYLGTGTTTAIASAIRDRRIDEGRFFSIEVNPKHAVRAHANLERAGLAEFVEILEGLSVPLALLPRFEQIESDLVGTVQADGIFVDHEEADRAR
ncbi:MAG: hypothetical protein ACREJC_11790, partial [Tepidisphaeraceae bacterium]